ncbi:hypothetical protein ACFYPZ_00690 [Streptomyces sp. NPDC005506]|uniref:hypothetical protein n=1 Tax=unclassified Streptomyces TaxID=2593676 RepID=UPI00367A46BE
MMQLSAQATHGGQVFLLIWGVGALIMGSAIASKKGAGWFRKVTVSGLREDPWSRPARRALVACE